MNFVLVTLLFSLIQERAFSSPSQGSFTKVIVPKANLNIWSDLTQVFLLADCISLCLKTDDEKCHAVVHDRNDGTCSFGNIIVPASTQSKIISKSEPGPDDVEIYARKGIVKPRSGYVPVLLSFFNNDISQRRLTATPEVTGDIPSTITSSQIYGNAKNGDIPVFIVHYGDGFIACGGTTTADQVIKTCKYVGFFHDVYI